MIALELKNVSKSYKGKPVLENISYAFQSGCYCIIGANGIGKTTFLDILAGVQIQNAGTISFVENIRLESSSLKYKKKLCYIPSKPTFFPTATGRDYLNFINSLKVGKNDKLCEIQNQIELFNIDKHLDTKFGEMSLGTQKKFFLTTLIMGESKLMILDEPTNGLDKEAKSVLVSLIAKLSNDAIVIIATHDQDLISSLKPRVIRLHQSPIQTLAVSEEML